MKSNKSIERLLTVIVVLLIFNLAKDWDFIPKLHANSENNLSFEMPAQKDTSYVIIVGLSEGLELPVSLDEPVTVQNGINSPLAIVPDRRSTMEVTVTNPVEVLNKLGNGLYVRNHYQNPLYVENE